MSLPTWNEIDALYDPQKILTEIRDNRDETIRQLQAECTRIKLEAAKELDSNSVLMQQALDIIRRLNSEIDDLRTLVRELTDDGKCDYDHNDYCQSHSLHDRPCPHGRAKALQGKAWPWTSSGEKK